MNIKMITISENGHVCIPEVIQMRPFEIAALFGVYERTIKALIYAVVKSGVVKMDVSCIAIAEGNTIKPCIYGLDMITAIAFRVDSPKAELFRKWVKCQIDECTKPSLEKLIIQLSHSYMLN